jgi:hypothetical protein
MLTAEQSATQGFGTLIIRASSLAKLAGGKPHCLEQIERGAAVSLASNPVTGTNTDDRQRQAVEVAHQESYWAVLS